MMEIKEGIVWSWGSVTVLCIFIIIMNSLHVVDLEKTNDELNKEIEGVKGECTQMLSAQSGNRTCPELPKVDTEWCAANCDGFEIGKCEVSFDVNVDDCSQSYRYEKTVVDLTRNTVGFEVPEVMVAIDDVCTTDECDYSDENPNQWIMEE